MTPEVPATTLPALIERAAQAMADYDSVPLEYRHEGEMARYRALATAALSTPAEAQPAVAWEGEAYRKGWRDATAAAELKAASADPPVAWRWETKGNEFGWSWNYGPENPRFEEMYADHASWLRNVQPLYATAPPAVPMEVREVTVEMLGEALGVEPHNLASWRINGAVGITWYALEQAAETLRAWVGSKQNG